jgi:hypothetical protein
MMALVLLVKSVPATFLPSSEVARSPAVGGTVSEVFLEATGLLESPS